MSSTEVEGELVPETRVLAIASHVVYGHVGNSMATFVMQSMGCETAALNTVHFSNHTGYRQVKGTKTSAQEIRDLYQGLSQSYLTDFDVLLSGYIPSAEAIDAVLEIGLDLKSKAQDKPGSFFWVLDPVMGDQGRLYVNEDVVPTYKKTIQHADLILPNQFEAELLSGIKISTIKDLSDSIRAIHKQHSVPHIIVTSVQLSALGTDTPPSTLTIIGSTIRSDNTPRLFRIDIPALDCFFSGTGDMFAALTVARLREAVFAAAATDPSLLATASWISPDDVTPTELPLAKATEKVLSSMYDVLEKTLEARNAELQSISSSINHSTRTFHTEDERQKFLHLRRTKAAEVRLIRNVDLLRRPITKFKAKTWQE